MPFSVTQGGKCVAHVLLKYKPKRALVFVRAKGKCLSKQAPTDFKRLEWPLHMWVLPLSMHKGVVGQQINNLGIVEVLHWYQNLGLCCPWRWRYDLFEMCMPQNADVNFYFSSLPEAWQSWIPHKSCSCTVWLYMYIHEDTKRRRERGVPDSILHKNFRKNSPVTFILNSISCVTNI